MTAGPQCVSCGLRQEQQLPEHAAGFSLINGRQGNAHVACCMPQLSRAL